MSVHEIRPQRPPEDLDPRTRPRYSTHDEALEDAGRVLDRLVEQLDLALIPDPADVRFLALRARSLVAACRRGISQDHAPDAGGTS